MLKDGAGEDSRAEKLVFTRLTTFKLLKLFHLVQKTSLPISVDRIGNLNASPWVLFQFESFILKLFLA